MDEEEMEIDWFEEPEEQDPSSYLLDIAQTNYEQKIYGEKNICQYKPLKQT